MEKSLKQLLLKDLCARLPYGVKIEGYELPCIILNADWYLFIVNHLEYEIRRPYLRPMSSMTEEEREEFYYFDSLLNHDPVGLIDWLNAHHFDYRGLIEKGLAIEVTKENNPYKE